jgi:uncharacterized protein YqeY
MSLQTQIADDMKTAMKARDAATRDALRMLISACKNKAIELGRGPQGELSDEEVQALLATEKKRREEAASGFEDGGRTESAASERAEAELIAGYLPAQLTDEELEAIVDEVVAEAGPDANMGQLMKGSMAKVGNLANGKRVQAVVKTRL